MYTYICCLRLYTHADEFNVYEKLVYISNDHKFVNQNRKKEKKGKTIREKGEISTQTNKHTCKQQIYSIGICNCTRNALGIAHLYPPPFGALLHLHIYN